MESSPSLPNPYEGYGEGKDKDGKEKDKDDKKSFSFRAPLPASEIHTRDSSNERSLFPLFEKPETKEQPAAEQAKAEHEPDTAEETEGEQPAVPASIESNLERPAQEAEQPETTVDVPVPPASVEATTEGPHPALEELHDDLWEEFDTTHPAAVEAEMRRYDTIGHPPEQQPAVQPLERAPAPDEQAWHEAHTVHLNESEAVPEVPGPEAVPPVPSAAGMAAEVAATEPDETWEAFNTAEPAVEVPAWHPDNRTNLRFEDMMHRADMGKEFEAATSEAPQPEPAMSTRPVQGGEPVRVAMPTETNANYPVGPQSEIQPEPDEATNATGGEAPQWYPAGDPRLLRRHGGLGGPASVLAHGAEAAVLAGASLGAAHAAETGVIAGAAAGAVAGGVAGHMAGGAAARSENRRLQEHIEAQNEHIVALTNEQHLTNQEIERSITENRERGITQQAVEKAAQERQAEAVAAARAQAERVTAVNSSEKVVRSEWVDMVVDKRTGKLVEREGVNEFGDGLRAEQRAESEPPDPVAAALAAAQAAAQSVSDYADPVIDGVDPMLGSGQADVYHELGAGQGPIDPSHRLSAPPNPVITAITSPLLWVGVVVLVLAFFAAAFL